MSGAERGEAKIGKRDPSEKRPFLSRLINHNGEQHQSNTSRRNASSTGAAYSQAPTGTIAGVVTDSAGAPVAGARVRITNRDSGLTRSLTTSAEGDYSAAALVPGV
jgi:hypothetical protein